jgi:hypothetical protein
MRVSTPQLLKLIALPVIAAVVTFILLMMSASVVSGMSRPMQGESVTAPWAACVLASVGVSLFLPWLASLPILRERSFRIYFFICLAAPTVIWYFMGFEGLLSKAYKRGL